MHVGGLFKTAVLTYSPTISAFANANETSLFSHHFNFTFGVLEAKAIYSDIMDQFSITTDANVLGFLMVNM